MEKKYIPTEREMKAIRLIARMQRQGKKDISCAVVADELGTGYQNCSNMLNKLCMLKFIKIENNFVHNKSKNNYSLDAMSFEYESLTGERK